MNLVEHPQKGMKVWLSESEVDGLIASTTDTERRIALSLSARSGLRTAEILDVKPDHVVDSEHGTTLVIPHGKGDKYRETPIPPETAAQIRTIGDMGGKPDEPVLSVTTTRALRVWMDKIREEMSDSTGDDRWLNLSFHDLRRTWATNLANSEVDPLIICQWAGWTDIETYLNYYHGSYSPAAQRSARTKVDWL